MPYTIFPTGTTIYNPAKSHNCFVLFDGRDGRSFLIDMNGNLVHAWPYCGFPVEMIDPEINGGRRGDIICQKEPDIFANETLLIVDWKADIVWEYVNPYFGEWVDHDVESGGSLSNWIFRAQPIPYEWVPESVSRSEKPVMEIDVSAFRVPSN